MSRHVLIIDTETTALVPDYPGGSGVIWELALIDQVTGTGHLWRMEPDLSKADPQALTVGGYYKRTRDMCTRCTPSRAHDLTQPTRTGDREWSDPAELAPVVAVLLDGAVLIGANPSFDAAFLTAFLRQHGQAPTWHYRLRDIGSMAYGYLSRDGKYHSEPLPIDLSTDDYARLLGIDPGAFERHSALGDCLLVAAMLAKIEGAS